MTKTKLQLTVRPMSDMQQLKLSEKVAKFSSVFDIDLRVRIHLATDRRHQWYKPAR